MARIETIGDATLYLADCRDVLPLVAATDAVVTDPPYGVGFDYGANGHDDAPKAYAESVVSRIMDAEKLVEPMGTMCVFQSAVHVSRWPEWFPRDFRPIAITKAFVQMRAGFITSATDYALIWFPNGRPKTKPDWQPEPARDWFYSAETAIPRKGPERDHPCPRPLDMMKYLVSVLCPPRSRILDPFMGSGTTGVAAIKLGRKFVGAEVDPAYFDIACRRLEDATRQNDLFIETKDDAIAAAMPKLLL